MALAIATNSAALQAAASASSVNRDMETSMARLASGKRINSASDDAAGVAIASRLSSEIRGTDQAIRNALDGQALIDSAEGAHKEIEAILQRMREVSVQAANDTNSADDRANLQAELAALITEIDRIASVTTWAGQTLLTGGTSFSFQVGAATGTKNQIAVTINDMSKATLNISGGATANTISALTSGADTVGVSAVTTTGILTLDATKTTVYKAHIETSKIVGGTNGTADTTKAHRDASALDFVTKINADATLASKGIKAVALADAAVVGSTNTAGGGTPAAVVITSGGDNSAITFTVAGTDSNGNAISETLAGANAGASTTTATFATVSSITSSGAITGTLDVGVAGSAATLEAIVKDAANGTNGTIEMNGVSANARIELLHGSDDLSTQVKALHAIGVIDSAIKTVNTQRSELGAVANRMSHTVANLTNISANLSAAKGGIEDADFAVETTQLAKNQILQQASTAMLAQANASKANVLSLLRA